jgi:hypothetical protein
MLESLEDYLTISDWQPPGGTGGEPGSCTRCGKRDAEVHVCIPCLTEVAARMAAKRSGVTPKMTHAGRRRFGVLEWLTVTVLTLGVLAAGSLLGAMIR